MQYLIITLSLLISNNFYSQTEGIFEVSDGVLVISNDLSTDRKKGYNGTTSKKAMKFYNQAFETSQVDVFKAIKLYNESIKIDPYFVEAYDNLGRLYRVVKDYNSAIECYQKSIALYPEGVTAHQNLAVVYEMLNDFESAKKEYRFLIELNPLDPEGYYGLGYMQLWSAETVQSLYDALDNAKKALELYTLNPPNYIGDSYFLIGYIYIYLNKNEEADRYFELAKKSYQENNLIDSWLYKEKMIESARE